MALQTWSFPKKSGIYLLMKDGAVAYVGMSEKDMLSRWQSHLKGKDFDDMKFLPLSTEEANIKSIERAIIRCVRPVLNKTHSGTMPDHDDELFYDFFLTHDPELPILLPRHPDSIRTEEPEKAGRKGRKGRGRSTGRTYITIDYKNKRTKKGEIVYYVAAHVVDNRMTMPEHTRPLTKEGWKRACEDQDIANKTVKVLIERFNRIADERGDDVAIKRVFKRAKKPANEEEKAPGRKALKTFVAKPLDPFDEAMKIHGQIAGSA